MRIQKNNQRLKSQKWQSLAVFLLMSLSPLMQIQAEERDVEELPSLESIELDSYSRFDFPAPEEDRITGGAFSFDNDILSPTGTDRDYTYGVSVTLAGSGVDDLWAAPSRPLSWLNSAFGLRSKDSRPVQSSVEFGAYGFTPDDISGVEANPEDRPYASLVYASSVQDLASSNPNVSWRTNLTVGVLGLDFVGDSQNAVHSLIGAERANGWRNQISDGGELTARYSVARQQLVETSIPKLELKTTAQASIGYLTEASYGVSARYGKVASRWQSFNPGLTTYGEGANQSVGQLDLVESYWTVGATFRARLYNAFLQGQFRDSAVVFDSDQLNSEIFEAWIGYTHGFRSGLRVSYVLRGQTSEVKEGLADRNLIWGSLTVSKSF